MPRDRSRWTSLLVFPLLALLGAGYTLLAPKEVNGDGVGYLKQVEGTALTPGHPAYLPILRTIARQVTSGSGPTRLTDLVLPFRLFSAACALLALLILFGLARGIYGARRALFAVAFLGLSEAFFLSAVQVETYAAATLLSTTAIWSLARYARCCSTVEPARWRGLAGIGWAALAGLLAGAAAHFHLTLALCGLSLVLLLYRWGRPGHRTAPVIVGAGMMALIVLLPLVWLAAAQGKGTVAEAGAWLASSDHGISYPHSWRTPLAAAWGLIRSLCHVPYPYESQMALVGALTIVGGLAWLALLLLRRRRGPDPAQAEQIQLFDGRFLLIWSAPLVAFGLFFFPSDTERWIFVMPAMALYLAPAAGRASALVLLVVAVINVAVGRLPALDGGSVDRAEAVDRLVPPTALVVSPGHGWDELVGLSTLAPPRRFPLVYHVGARRDLPTAVSLMHRQIDKALAAKERVFVARLRDPDDPRGFKELSWLGLSTERFARLFDRYAPRPTVVPGLWELSPPR